MANDYKGWVIDSSTGNIRKFTGRAAQIRKELNCRYFTIVTIELNDQRWDLYLDDEGMYNQRDRGFILKGGYGEFFGNGVLLGFNREDGSTRSCNLNKQQVQEAFNFWVNVE